MKSELLFVAKMAVSAKHTHCKQLYSFTLILKNTLTLFTLYTIIGYMVNEYSGRFDCGGWSHSSGWTSSKDKNES